MKAADKLKKASTIKATSSLSESEVYSSRVTVETQVPMVNVAFSGDIDSGFTSGVTIFAGPSKHFKTMFSLLCAKSFLDKYEDGVVLFYDSEFGSPPEYFKTLGIDPERVVHTPVVNVEELRTDLANQLKNIERTDRVCIVIDSLGNLASIKETEDAEAGKNVADMTRAKQIKSLFRIVTPQLTLRDIPMFVVSHTYDTMEMFSKQVVSGGKGQYYSANNIFIIGRRQNKTGKELDGYDFIINVDKSRTVKEKSVIPISVEFGKGIVKYSGLLELAKHLGFVDSPSLGWFEAINPESGEVLSDRKYRKAETNCKEFWEPLFNQTDFKSKIREFYQVSTNSLIQDQETEEEIMEELELETE
jgi:hypothetical protein